MDSRYFNSIMPKYNENWAAKVLKMKLNAHNGADLIDNKKIVEIKFTKKFNSKNYYKWTVIEYQMDYPKNKNKPGFWGMGFYDLNTPISEIKNSNNLEKFVNSRELIIVDWNWMNQFKPHFTSGNSELTKWEYTLRYPKFSKLPEIQKSLNVEGGKIFFAKNVNMEYYEKIIKNSMPYYKEI